jgi:hypothetical protein
MAIDGSWLVFRKTVRGTGMVMDRSLLVLSDTGTKASFLRPDQTTTELTNLTYTAATKVFKNTTAGAGPYIQGVLTEDALKPENNYLAGWIGDNGTRDKVDSFVAVPSPFEGSNVWSVQPVKVLGSGVIASPSYLNIAGRTVTFTKHGGVLPESLAGVMVGVDSLVKDYPSSGEGYRIEARLVRRGETRYLVGTIAKGTLTTAGDNEHSLCTDNDMDTFTAVRTGGGLGRDDDDG